MVDPHNHNNPNQKNTMHPEDIRNMFLFFFIAAVLYIGYNYFILTPQKEAMEAAQKAQAELAENPQDPVNLRIEEAKNPLPRDQVLTSATEQKITIQNEALTGSITTKGARINDLTLNKYFETLEKDQNVAILSPNKTQFPRFVEYGWTSSDPSLTLPNKETIWKIEEGSNLTPGSSVKLTWNNGQGLIFQRIIELDEQYMFTITQNVVNNSGRAITLYPFGLISQRGQPPYFAGTWISHEGPMGYIGDELHEPSYKSLRKGKGFDERANQGWIGITDKYWLTAMIPPQGQDVKYSFNYAGTKKDSNNIGRYQTDFLGQAVMLSNGQSSSVQSQLFLGAKEVLTLNAYEKDLDIPQFNLAVNFGLLWFMSKPFFYFLHYAGEWIGNFGVAIILLTIIIRTFVFPLTNMSYKSFAGMKKVNPQIVELRQQHGEDKQKLQQELVKLYQKEGVNPMSGCLPILLQIPIFFALYRVLFVTIEMRHAPFFGWIQDLSAPDPTSIFNLFGLIPWDPPQILMIGVWPCMMLVVMLIQKNLNPPPQDKLQKDIAFWMPYFFAFIMAGFAAGLVVYWAFSALIGVIQQIIIMKRMNVPIHLFGETKEEAVEDEAVAEEAATANEEAVEDEKASEPPKPIKPPKPKKSKKKKK